MPRRAGAGSVIDVDTTSRSHAAQATAAERTRAAQLTGPMTTHAPTAVALPQLFSPTVVGTLAVPNRIVMAPMTRTRAGDAGVPGPDNAEYYRQRASAGLLVTECTYVSPLGRGILRSPGLVNAEQVDGWRRVAGAVHGAGGRIVVQLWHSGRIAHPALLGGAWPVAPSPVAASGTIFTPAGPLPYPAPRELDAGEIAGIVGDFRVAAANALAAGVDGVELHGAFGYLVDQFLQDGTNRRTDGYGGSAANRARFLLEVTQALVDVWGAGRVGVKLSPSSRHYGQHDSDPVRTFSHAATALDELGIAYLHVMEPNAQDLAAGGAPTDNARWVRPLFRRALIANGSFDGPRAEAAVAEGAADLVSFGVPFVANPDLPRRLAEGGPFNAPDPSTFYGEGPRGYTDYPALAAA